MSNCPYGDIRFCPLYLAAHGPDGGGCDDGRLGEGGCAVGRGFGRGMDYGAALGRLQAAHSGMIARAESAEWQEAAQRQRARNRRAAGLAS
ncbi:MAG TPA: hypothetical protein VGA75_10615 [Paracoccaceae bacterium]